MRHLFLLVLCAALTGAWAQTNRVDSKGRKQGKWVKYHDKTQVIRYKGEFQDDIPINTFVYYHLSGIPKAEHSYRGKTNVCYAREYNEQGKRVAEGLYNHQKRDSVWTYYNDQGLVLQRETYVKGILNGESLLYYENGQVAERKSYLNDQLHGPWEQWFEDGLPKAKANYVNGLMEGEATYYGLLGKVAAKGKFEQGLKHGPWYFFTIDGKLEKKVIYNRGQEKRPPKASEPPQASEDE
jgi:antitoxin component YwqK of YwqJK toxin-antitoxin module